VLRGLIAWLLHRRRRRHLDLDRRQLRRFTVSPLPRFSRRLQRRSLSSSQLAARSSAGFVRWAVVAAATCVVAACTAGSAAPSFPATHQRLIFIAEATFGTSVYVMDADTGRRHELILPSLGVNAGVASSANGTQLAYTNTTLPLLLDELPPRVRRRHPALPPSQLGFGTFTPRSAAGGSLFLYLVGPPQIPAYGRPAWSPDGRELAFAGGQKGQLDIYLLRPGRPARPINLTPNSPGNDQDPSWSPDGHTIAFVSNRGGDSDIYLMNPDGGDIRDLTNDRARERYPDWAPSGSSLVFTSNRSGNNELYTSERDGTDVHQLTNDAADNQHPVWSPDGKWIAFSSNRDDERDLYLIGAQGGSERQLTSTATDEIVQDWQPLQDTIPPRVTALPSHALRDHNIYLRYRIRENSHRVQLSATITSPHGEISLGFTPFLHRLPNHTYALRVDDDSLYDEPLPNRASFCISASDPSGNTNRRCSTIRLFRP
jgi:Tol biopolymer transport system component